MALLPIPDDFGKGGANIGDGSPTLGEILQNHAEEIGAGGADATARAAAATAQATADGAVAINNAQNIQITSLLDSRDKLESTTPGSGIGTQRVGIGFGPDQFGYVGMATLDEVLQRMSDLGVPRSIQIFDDNNATVSVADASVFVMRANVLTANRTLILSVAGLTEGEVLRVVKLDKEAFTLAIVNGGPGAGTMFTFPASSGQIRMAQFKFDGTNLVLDYHTRLYFAGA